MFGTIIIDRSTSSGGGGGSSAGDENAVQVSDGSGGFVASGIYAASGVIRATGIYPSIEPSAYSLWDNTGSYYSVDYGNRWLFGSTGAVSVDWANRWLCDVAGNWVIDWVNRQMKASDGTVVFDWSGGAVINGVAFPTDAPNEGDMLVVSSGSLTWSSGPTNYTGEIQLANGSGGLQGSSVWVSAGYFLDGNEGSCSIHTGNRQLYATDGTTIVFDWNSQEAAISDLSTSTGDSNVDATNAKTNQVLAVLRNKGIIAT